VPLPAAQALLEARDGADRDRVREYRPVLRDFVKFGFGSGPT
jgi:hypothetical protein